MISLICAHCANEFKVYPSRIKEGCKVCSLKCFHLLRTETTEKRFNRLVRRSADPNACWEWTGSITTAGYGGLRNSEQNNNTTAHRVSYQIHIGPIPPGMFVCHTCDNPPCCNPRHLFLGTQAENVADMDAKGRRKAVAPKGVDHHKAKLTEANVLIIRANSEPLTTVAARYGVGETTISSIRRRHTWRHIP